MILIDINVLLDVVQRREPHYQTSAAVLDQVIRKKVSGALPAHGITTVHFIVSRYQTRKTASQVVEWLLARFAVAAVGKAELVRAQALAWEDFEDAVVAAVAESSGCEAIVTRNIRDFGRSPRNGRHARGVLARFRQR